MTPGLEMPAHCSAQTAWSTVLAQTELHVLIGFGVKTHLLDDRHLAQIPCRAALNQGDVSRQAHPVHMVTGRCKTQGDGVGRTRWQR